MRYLLEYVMALKIKSLEAKLLSEWVSVEERLPEDTQDKPCKEYLVLKGGCIRIAQFDSAMAHPWYDPDLLDEMFNITHWRPLPTPPDETKRGKG